MELCRAWLGMVLGSVQANQLEMAVVLSSVVAREASGWQHRGCGAWPSFPPRHQRPLATLPFSASGSRGGHGRGAKSPPTGWRSGGSLCWASA